MSKFAKIFDYLVNPVGSGVADLIGKINPKWGDAVRKIATPFGANWAEDTVRNFSRGHRAATIRSEIEAAASKAGMSLEEYLAINPDIADTYNNADRGIIDRVLNNEHVQSAIENVTGERDTKENEKNRQFQHDEAEITRNWEAEQAQQSREWDSIGAQMERAAAAGVNPVSIAMQNGGVSYSGSSPIPSSPGLPAGSNGLMHNGLLDIASTVFSGIGTFAEQRLKQSQSDDIVAMRQFNIAEKIANTDHLKRLCEGVELSNTAQSIQNSWLDKLNQVQYDEMMKRAGYYEAMSDEAHSVSKLNLKQIDEISQNMELALKRFNSTLPLELQLMESDINFKNMSVQDLYSEICLRHLQAIEQENRNRQSAEEAEQSSLQTGIAKATYEDAIHAFHNDMIKGASQAGISYYDYLYYGCKPGSVANLPGSVVINGKLRKNRKRGWIQSAPFNPFIQGLGNSE